MKWSVFVLNGIVAAGLLRADSVTFESGEKKVSLLELYTSEGCSSCPPAEAWLTTLKAKAGLWQEFVPVAFHVDYWNSLGWPDRYSSADFTRRQRDYAAAWQADSVYTPEFVLNAREWRSALGRQPEQSGVNSGRLRVTVSNKKEIQAVFSPAFPATSPLTLTVVPLGMGVTTKVLRGENAGRDLAHDFVALALVTTPLKQVADGSFTATVEMPAGLACPPNALAAWVSGERNTPPIQVTGGLFPPEK